MADLSYSMRKQGIGEEISYLKRYVVVEVASVDDADTVTIVELDAIDNAKVINLSDATDVGSTVLTNVVTIDEGALADAHVLIVAVGTVT